MLLLATITLALLASARAAQPARAGEYRVRLTSTSGAHWSTYGTGPFIVSPNRVASGKGVFAPGNYRSWRANVVGAGARIVGGTMRIGVTTPNANMRGRIVAGTGSSSTVVHEEYGTGGVERSFPPGTYDWVQFDISSTGSVTTSAPSQDHVDLQFVELVMRDDVPPVLEGLSMPAPGTWYSASACIPFTIRLTDQGGGLLRSQVRRASDGAIVTELGTTQVESPKPGPTEQHLSDCIAPGERGHGDTTFIATVWDVSGVARELAFTVRADHHPPAIGAGPADGARFTIARPELSFSVVDDGSGLAGVSATVDGAPVAISMNAGVATLQTGDLSRGDHVVAVAASDATGNASRIERRISVVDSTKPTLSLTSPGARGDATFTLAARAGDDMSGIDPASWSVQVDGAAAAFTVGADAITGKLGPLAGGTHRIDIGVSDRAGNRATVTHSYYVVLPAPAPASPTEPRPASATAPPPPGRSGVFLVDAPRAAVRFGQVATVSVHVVRDGTPVAGQRVTSRRDAHELASAVTDADGVARVRVPARAPGRYDAIADGMGFDPVRLPIRVAPRVVITTSTLRPKVGQRVRLSGRIFPALRGRVISVEARIGGVWFPIRRIARTNVAGRFATTVVSATPGPVHVRVKLKPKGAWAGTISNARLLRVHR